MIYELIELKKVEGWYRAEIHLPDSDYYDYIWILTHNKKEAIYELRHKHNIKVSHKFY